MRIVHAPVKPPYTCAILPNRGAPSEKEGWIEGDVHFDGWDQQVYLSFAGIKEAGRIVGLVPRERHAEVLAEAEGLRKQLQHLQDELDQVHAQLDAIDVIESADFRSRKKTGRKPKAKAA